MAAVRKFVRIIGSPRNSAAPLVSSSGTSPRFSGDNGSAPLQPPTAVCQCPAKLRLPTHGLEFGRFRFAYAAPRSHQSPEPDTVVAGRRPHPSRLAVSLPTQRLERGTTATSSRACSYSMNSDTSPSTKPAPTCCSRSSARDTSAAPPNHDQSRLPKMAGILQQRRHADLRRPRPASPPCGNHRHRGKKLQNERRQLRILTAKTTSRKTTTSNRWI